MYFRQIAILLVSLFTLTSCDFIYPAGWNYRITIMVETPDGMKTGSAVRHIDAFRPMAFNPDVPDIRFKVLGEAVVVDLGEYGVLFATIKHSSFEEYFSAFGLDKSSPAQKLEFNKNIRVGETAFLKNNYPYLIAFEDLDDPSTAVAVNIGEFEKVFGEGVIFRAIKIEKTKDPVTYGAVRQKLHWLDEYFDKRLDGNRYLTLYTDNRTANSLSAGSFTTRRD